MGFCDREVFVLTEEHLKLLQRMFVEWNDEAYDGAPQIDLKRPYGNSDVVGDVVEILGWECNSHVDGWDNPRPSTEQKEAAMKLHRETETALQIVLQTMSFAPGTYVSEQYSSKWTLANTN